MSVVGFGSLLSQRSSRFTFPELQNFRLARLRGFRRVFAHITPFFFKACVLLYRVPTVITCGLSSSGTLAGASAYAEA